MNERRQLIYDNNVDVMDILGPLYSWSSTDKTCMLIRERGEIKVDFYPHTGKWKFTINHAQKIYTGHAGLFIRWYDERRINPLPFIGEFM